MRYRQWKKNYKKRHGINPPDSIVQQDQLQHYKANYPEMVKAVKASKDGYRAETVIYDELLHQWTDKECSE